MKHKFTHKKPNKPSDKGVLPRFKGKPCKDKKVQNTTTKSSVPVLLEAGQNPQLIWKQLMQERHRNEVLQMEIEWLRKSLEASKKCVQDVNIEVECKNNLLNKLIENKTRIESTSYGIIEEELDIDNLLHANLGDMDIDDLLNFADTAFNEDLDKLDMTKIDKEDLQFPNRESSRDEKAPATKDDVGQIMDQKGSFQFSSEEVRNMSPIKMIKGKSQSHASNTPTNVGDLPIVRKKCPLVPEDNREADLVANCSPCPHYDQLFPIEVQWKKTNHLTLAHNRYMLYSCHFCDKKFSFKSILRAHVTWHCQTSAWQCRDCGYKLCNLTQFIKHIKSVHSIINIMSANTLLKQCRE